MSDSHAIMRGMYGKHLDPDQLRKKAALEALDAAMMRSFLGRYSCHGGQQGRPGEVIQSMSPEAREALKDLKGEDTFNIRPEYCA